MWRVYIAATAEKQLKKLPSKDRERIRIVLREMWTDPFAGDLVKIDGTRWRRRLGSYRLVFEIIIAASMVYVFDIKRRTTTTYK
jgi:mRNA-degrading endonuclease RelE of RelBE toxin-antitoxin system